MSEGRPNLEQGLYERPVTVELERLLEQARVHGFRADVRDLDESDGYELLAQHVYEHLRAYLRGLPAKDRLERQLEVTNRVLEALEDPSMALVSPLQELRAISENQKFIGENNTGLSIARPRVPLSQSDLLVNARGEPSVGQALAEEIRSSDRVDLLCAFIRWNGIRILWPALQDLRRCGRQLRVITTTYIGATERKALDALESIGAEVKVSYERQSTRLHAKAWLLKRLSAFSTAYVGSSNLSKSALVDGLEWNVRLSQVRNPDVLEKFEATFESYWQDPSFESYSSEFDAERLAEIRGHNTNFSPKCGEEAEPEIGIASPHG